MVKIKTPHVDFIWTPGNGPDETARQRLIHRFPKPTSPMGEAWFMSNERRMYTEALQITFEYLDHTITNRMFDEIITGPPCFGQLDEWQRWFHYFLPNLIPLAFKKPGTSYIAEWLASAIFSQLPEGLEDGPYRGFRDDVLATLGQVLMAPDIWQDGHLKWQGGLFKEGGRYGDSSWYLDQTSPPISALLFFCVKYLRPSQIEPWFRSAINIDCPLWRSQLIVWLTGARRILTGEITQPKDFGDLESRVQWEWSHVHSGNYSGNFPPPALIMNARGKNITDQRNCDEEQLSNISFIPKVNLLAFRSCLNAQLPKSAREALAYQVMDVPLLEKEMGVIATEFVDMDFK